MRFHVGYNILRDVSDKVLCVNTNGVRTNISDNLGHRIFFPIHDILVHFETFVEIKYGKNII